MQNDTINKSRQRIEFVRRYGTVIGALMIFIIFSFASENFFTARNFMMLLRQLSMLTIVAMGFTFVMAAGGFDMSIGNLTGLINMVFTIVLLNTNSFLLATIAGITIGLIVGFVNGTLVAYIGLPDFIATFAVGSIVYGIKMLLTKGNPIFFREDAPAIAKAIGQGYLGPIPLPVIFMLIYVLLGIFVLSKTSFGRRIYAIGGNATASIFAGIDIKKYRRYTFLISGFSVALAAIILTSRLGSGQPLAGEDFLLDAIAVAFLSSTMFGEGEPNGAGTFVGAFIVGMLNNGLTMLNVPYYFQYITKGLVVILAVVLSAVFAKKLSE
ncbi:MAG: ABC transporter permease [Gudongella sp.]|nr:ABC transporter permease [Gudongella sp.]